MAATGDPRRVVWEPNFMPGVVHFLDPFRYRSNFHKHNANLSNPEALKTAMLRRSKPEEAAMVDQIVSLDGAYRKALAEKETLLARRNAASKEIGQAMAAKDAAKAEALKAEVATVKERIAALESETAKAEAEIRDILPGIPNVPFNEVPEGEDEHGNVEYRRHGAVPNLPFAPKEHYELGEALGMMDFETAAKLSGSRFVVLQRGLARLERALGQFMLDTHTMEHGYTEVNPPILVKDDANNFNRNLANQPYGKRDFDLDGPACNVDR